MGGSEPAAAGGTQSDPAAVLDDELATVLHCAVHQAARRLRGVAAAVYLLTADGRELRPAMIGGSPPSVLTLPGRMSLDSPYASARALAGGGVALLAEPDPLTEPEYGVLAYPYTVASVPLETGDRRFGSLTVLRGEDRGAYDEADRRRLSRVGERLVVLLSDLVARGAVIVPGPLPVLVPVLGTEPPAGPEDEFTRGVPGVAGSAGLTLMYALRRLPDGGVRPLAAPANVPLGLRDRAHYRSADHPLPPGAVLALYSDGLLEPDADGVAARLAAVGRRAGADPEELADGLLKSTPGRRDDAVLLLARYEEAGDGAAPRTAQLHVQRRDLRGVGEARGFVRGRLCEWGLADPAGLADDLELITSELVTNALIHAGSDVDLRLRVHGDRVRLEVRDSDSDPPVPTAYSLTEEGSARAEHGRGLFLVDALARTWSTSPSGRGKTVWLEMDVPEPDGGG